MIVKAGLFEAQTEQRFQSETRQQPVYLDLASVVADIIRINFPPTMSVASPPAKNAEKLDNDLSYTLSTDTNATSMSIRRNFSIGRLIYPVSDYPRLQSFYAKVYTSDQEPIVFARSTPNGN